MLAFRVFLVFFVPIVIVIALFARYVGRPALSKIISACSERDEAIAAKKKIEEEERATMEAFIQNARRQIDEEHPEITQHNQS